MTPSSISDKNFKFAFVGWWLVWTCIHTWTLSTFGFTWTIAFIDGVVSNILLAATCLLIGNNMRYYLPQQERYWYVLIISLAMSGVWIVATRLCLHLIFAADFTYLAVLSRSIPFRFAIGFLMVSCMAMMSLSWYTQQEQKEANARQASALQLAKDSELYKLRQQLQPHFLFNSLNSISALTGSQPDKARHMIQQLSDFLRGTLKKDELAWISYEEELQYLNLYLEIEKVRFGYRLQTEVVSDNAALHMKLPALLLQPIVENAIKFGLYDTLGEVVIRIEASALAERLEIRVTNPFDPETARPLYGTGFGLSSVQRRLFLLFAQNNLLQTKAEGSNFITTVSIPQLV